MKTWDEFEQGLRASKNFILCGPDEQEEMLEWCSTRPYKIKRAMMERPMWNYYRIKDAGPATGTIHCYSEEESGEVTVEIDLYINTLFPRQVFGVNLASLEECGTLDTVRE